jgi:hypothetical protein
MVRSLLERLRSWWAVEDPDERIEGSGEVALDPAYNGRYTAERRLKQYAELDEADADYDELPDDR